MISYPIHVFPDSFHLNLIYIFKHVSFIKCYDIKNRFKHQIDIILKWKYCLYFYVNLGNYFCDLVILGVYLLSLNYIYHEFTLYYKVILYCTIFPYNHWITYIFYIF